MGIPDGIVDPQEVLVDDPPRPEVEMPDFTVPLIPLGQTGAQSGGLDDRGGAGAFISVGMGCFCAEDRVRRFVVTFTPSVADNEADQSFFHEKWVLSCYYYGNQVVQYRMKAYAVSAKQPFKKDVFKISAAIHL